MSEDTKDRRDFLVKLGIGAGVVGIGVQAAASVRSLLPNVSYDAPTTVKLGLPDEFPDGLKFLPEQRLFVVREGKVFQIELRNGTPVPPGPQECLRLSARVPITRSVPARST